MQLHRQFSWGRWHIGLGRYHQSPPFDQPELQNFAQSNQASTGLEWKISDSVLIGGDIWVKHSTDKWYVDPVGVTLIVDEEAVGGEAYVAARWDRWDGRVGVSSVHSQLLYDGDMYTGPFSQPFFVNAMLGWRSDSWTVGARYRILLRFAIDRASRCSVGCHARCLSSDIHPVSSGAHAKLSEDRCAGGTSMET